jgi:energy-coupling factor transport system permease protein
MSLARFDPRAKLMLMVCVSTLAVVWRNPAWLAGLLCFTVVVLAGGGASPRAVVGQARSVLRVIAVLFAVQCVFVRSGAPLISIGGFTLVTAGGLTVALVVTLRLLIVVFSAAILLTGDARDYLLALVQCKVPYEIAFMVMTALHFLPILREEALDVYYAVQMRGTELSKATLREKCRVYTRISLPILAGAIKRAERTSVAMEARAFRACPERTFMRRLTLARRDIVCLVVLPLLSATSLLASIRWR